MEGWRGKCGVDLELVLSIRAVRETVVLEIHVSTENGSDTLVGSDGEDASFVGSSDEVVVERFEVDVESCMIVIVREGRRNKSNSELWDVIEGSNNKDQHPNDE